MPFGEKSSECYRRELALLVATRQWRIFPTA